MNIRKMLLSLLSPAPLPESKDYRRTVMWPDCIGVRPIDDQLIDLALRAGQRARSLTLEQLNSRPNHDGLHQVWPGEHYRLLAALVELLQPKCVVEFGTYSGLSSLAMLTTLPADGHLATFDLLPWQQFPGTPLRETDFGTGRLAQHLDNLADPAGVERHRELLERADFFFIDGPKDGVTEPRLFANLQRLKLKPGSIFVIDDIHNQRLVPTWDALPFPKYDITSFGHWTGTGLLRWGNRQPAAT
jgi:predicted O-methyltransferase YrrM